jgi:hypothetical protein
MDWQKSPCYELALPPPLQCIIQGADITELLDQQQLPVDDALQAEQPSAQQQLQTMQQVEDVLAW